MKTRNDTPVTAFSANAAKGVENLLNAISTRVSGYLLPYFVSPDHFWHASRTYFQQRHTKKSHWSHENAQWYASYRIFGKRCERRLNAISTRVSGYLLPYFVSPDNFWHASRTYFQQRHTKKSHWSHENTQWYASYRIFLRWRIYWTLYQKGYQAIFFLILFRQRRLEHTFSKDILNSISTRVSGYLLPYFVSPDHFWHASRTYFQQRHTKKSHWSHENAQWYASYRIFGKRCERRG